MEEEKSNVNPEGAPMSESVPDLGKFKSVDALLHAYGELEAEFTRRSQRLKALEGELASAKEAQAAPREELRRASTEEQSAPAAPPAAPVASEMPVAAVASETPVTAAEAEVRVPLMGAGGAGVVSPKARPSSIREAGELALGYFRRAGVRG